MPPTLEQLDVIFLDGQTTGASPQHGRLLELAWLRNGEPDTTLRSFLLAQPADEPLPRRTTAITGITDSDLEGAAPAREVWSALRSDIAALTSLPAPCVIHFARFEAAFLRALHDELSPGEPFPLELVCTHEIAMRLLPGLPRRGLRAIAGHLGHGIGELRRAGPHALATALVWRELTALLRTEHSVHTLAELHRWMEDVSPVRTAGREFAIDRARRLALPEAPGVYRFLGKDGRVLYLGKATSLKRRVNSYFQKQKHSRALTLEMLTQAHDIEVQVEASPLEAALREADLIKEHEPPYNVALRDRDGGSPPGGELLCRHAVLVSLLGRSAAAFTTEHERQLVDSLGFPAEAVAEGQLLREGFAEFLQEHGIDADAGEPRAGAVRGLGARLWRRHLAEIERIRREQLAAKEDAGSPAVEEEDPELADETPREAGWRLQEPRQVVRAMEHVLREGARLHRLARWLRRLAHSVLVWRPGHRSTLGWRMLVVDDGKIVKACDLDTAAHAQRELAGSGSTLVELDRPTHDRLRVLNTELRRLVAAARRTGEREGAAPDVDDPELELWLAPGHVLGPESLHKRLLWV